MRTEQPVERSAGLFPRLLASIAVLGCRRPWLALAAVVLSGAVCLAYTACRLTYQTHRNDLIAKNKDYYQRWQQYVAEFGDDDDMVVVVQGEERAAVERTVEELAGAIAARPELFDRLFYKVDLRPLRDRALLFLPVEQIRLIHTNIQNMALLLEPPVLGAVDPLFGWKSMSLQQLLKEGERRAATCKPGEPNLEAEAFLRQLDAICRGAADFLADPKSYRNPWRSVVPSSPGQSEMLEKPQYFQSGDGKLAFLLVRPVKASGDSFTYAQQSIDALRALVADTAPRFPGVRLGVTGLPVLENDEMIASQNDSNRASWLALLGVALLYLVVYRGWRYPLTTVAALLVGTVWALGWTTLTVGHLNILSSAFAVMLIGMGDYGVLWVTHFGQERRAGYSLEEAMRRTARHAGPSILTAAVTTAFAFYAAMLADLRAVAELGWIAGSGVLLCAVSCFTVMPPLLALLERRRSPGAADVEAPAVLSLREHQEATRTWLPGLMQRPRWVLAACGLATLGLAYAALHVQYDSNLLNMQAQGLDSVRWERTLIEHTTGSSWNAVDWTATPEEALALKARYERLPGVSRVVTTAELVPLDQAHKLELMRDLQVRLRRLPPRGEVLAHALPPVDELQRDCRVIAEALTRLERIGRLTGGATLAIGARRLGAALAAAEAEPASYALKQYEEMMTRDLADDLHRLRDVATPRPIRITDLPASLRERYIGANGKWLVRIFSKECLWDYGPLEQFVAQVRTVNPDATGKPFTTLEGLKVMRSGFLWAGIYALAAMVLVLLIDFGSIKHTLVALLPLALGLIATLGIMALFGASLNPANMIAFPLILGVGADNGVHVLHDFRARPRHKRYALGHVTGRGILVAALTTILGFGTLLLAQHRGMASLGLVLTLGVTCCMLTALVFLPALLTLIGKRRRRRSASLKLAAGRRAA